MESRKIRTMLMFTGQAEEAMNLYLSLFGDSGVDFIARYGPEYPQGPEGKVVHAAFRLKGEPVLAMDSAVPQATTFTPNMSLYVECDDEAEIEKLAEGLSAGGSFLMPLDTYPFAKKYAWVQDSFGVSWQLYLT